MSDLSILQSNPKVLKPGYHRLRLEISYDGTDFSGWQRQKSHESVQETLEKAFSKVFKEPLKLLGASRTDAGVHAFGQVAHIDIPRSPDGIDIRRAVRPHLPRSIVIKSVWLAEPSFHAIADCEYKTYKYFILNRSQPSAFRYRYSWLQSGKFNLDNLQKMADCLVGTQDFKSFQSVGTHVETTVRTIHSADWSPHSKDSLVFTVTGDGFLKQMVRNIVGTLIWLERKALGPAEFKQILAEMDRRKAGPTAPPQGLFLYRVHYAAELDKKCRKL